MANNNLNRILRHYITILFLILICLLYSYHFEILADEKASELVLNQQSEYWPTKDWKTSTPERQGMKSEVLAEMFKIINDKNINISSSLIVRNGYIVAEANKNVTANYPIHSSTKSFTSAIFGIALSKGYIKNIDQKISNFFPEFFKGNNESRKSSITIRHLLTMSSGFDWPEIDTDYSNPENPVYQMIWMSRNWIEFIFNKPLTQEPGSVFNYNSGCSHLIMDILYKSGLDVEKFIQEFLFNPLGISNTQYTWSKDPNGILNGGFGLYMKPRDMAKFGYLYLKSGYWDNKQIISKAWIEESTKKQINISGKVGLLANNYGYQWYIQPFGFHSLGYKGQYIFIIPEHELVVVFTSDLIGSQIIIPISFIKTYIIPAVQTLAPLPENKNAITQLKSEIKRFEKK